MGDKISFSEGLSRYHLMLRHGSRTLRRQGEVEVLPPWLSKRILMAQLRGTRRRQLLRSLRRWLDLPALDPEALEQWVLMGIKLRLGPLVLLRERLEHPRIGLAEDAEVSEDELEAPVDSRLTRDWRVECQHHASAAARELCGKVRFIQVVPELDGGPPYHDEVLLHWRDDSIGMPSSLTVHCREGSDTQAKQAGSDGPYTRYSLDAEYRNEIPALHEFWKGAWWRQFSATTKYDIRPGPEAVQVEVFSPHKYKFELCLPPWRGFKAGAKLGLGKNNELEDLVDDIDELEFDLEVEKTSWKPSKLAVTEEKWSTVEGRPDHEKETSKKFDKVCFSRDGEALDLDVLQLISSLCELQASFRQLLDLLAKVPRVGWFAELEIQLLQGGLVAEWYWKEHTDHRVFRYIDINAALTLIKVKFELAFGVECGIRLQVYASICGEANLKGGACYDDPDADRTWKSPELEAKLTGALGARFEVGSMFKFDAKGETALEFVFEVDFGAPNSPFKLDYKWRWTGISFTATVSAGLFGIGGSKTWSATPVSPTRWFAQEFPQPKPYTPPTLSRARIETLLRAALTDGWDLRVIESSGSVFGIGDVHMSTAEIARQIAGEIVADPYFDRSPKVVEGIVLTIRTDLDALGEHWGRDYVEASDFKSYLEGKLKQRIRDAWSPERCYVGARA